MQVFIKTINGNTIILNCNTVDELKFLISEREKIHVDRQRLSYGGRELCSESIIIDGSTIHLSSRMSGGAADNLVLIACLVPLAVFLITAFIISRANNKIFFADVVPLLVQAGMSLGIIILVTIAGVLLFLYPFVIASVIALCLLSGVFWVKLVYGINKLIEIVKYIWSIITVKNFLLLISYVFYPLIALFKYVADAGKFDMSKAKERIDEHPMNLFQALTIIALFITSMYYTINSIEGVTDQVILSIFLLITTIPLIFRYVYKVSWPKSEPAIALVILYSLIANMWYVFTSKDEDIDASFRAVNINTCVIFILTYYYNSLFYNEPVKECLYKAFAISGTSGVFMVTVLSG